MNKIYALWCMGLLFSYNLNARNPFEFGYPTPRLIAIGMLEPEHTRFALMGIGHEYYTLFPGDIIEGHKIISINKDQVTLRNLKNKKALQLKI